MEHHSFFGLLANVLQLHNLNDEKILFENATVLFIVTEIAALSLRFTVGD